MSGELAYRASIAVVDVTAGLVHSFGEQALKPALGWLRKKNFPELTATNSLISYDYSSSPEANDEILIF